METMIVDSFLLESCLKGNKDIAANCVRWREDYIFEMGKIGLNVDGKEPFVMSVLCCRMTHQWLKTIILFCS